MPDAEDLLLFVIPVFGVVALMCNFHLISSLKGKIAAMEGELAQPAALLGDLEWNYTTRRTQVLQQKPAATVTAITATATSTASMSDSSSAWPVWLFLGALLAILLLTAGFFIYRRAYSERERVIVKPINHYTIVTPTPLNVYKIKAPPCLHIYKITIPAPVYVLPPTTTATTPVFEAPPATRPALLPAPAPSPAPQAPQAPVLPSAQPFTNTAIPPIFTAIASTSAKPFLFAPAPLSSAPTPSVPSFADTAIRPMFTAPSVPPPYSYTTTAPPPFFTAPPRALPTVPASTAPQVLPAPAAPAAALPLLAPSAPLAASGTTSVPSAPETAAAAELTPEEVAASTVDDGTEPKSPQLTKTQRKNARRTRKKLERREAMQNSEEDPAVQDE